MRNECAAAVLWTTSSARPWRMTMTTNPKEDAAEAVDEALRHLSCLNVEFNENSTYNPRPHTIPYGAILGIVYQ